MSATVRHPAVAGQFYAADRAALQKQVARYVVTGHERRRCIGVVSPHAGFMYSGPVAGALFSVVDIPGTVILLGPNHTGLGTRASIMTAGSWDMPGGAVPIEDELASALLRALPELRDDGNAHRFEHSLEVQLPFITFFRKDVRIVPITFMQLPIAECRRLGEGIAEAVRIYAKDVLIVASSDMSHYVQDEVARRKDRLAIERVEALDAEGLYAVVQEQDISMCGYIPATIMLFAARRLGASTAEVIRYATSADVSGDYEQVVGYAGIAVN